MSDLAAWTTTSELFREARVLVGDDDESNVALLERIRRGAGVGDVKGLTNSRLVAECCQSWQPPLIMFDRHMPHVDGIAVLNVLVDRERRRLRAHADDVGGRHLDRQGKRHLRRAP